MYLTNNWKETLSSLLLALVFHVTLTPYFWDAIMVLALAIMGRCAWLSLRLRSSPSLPPPYRSPDADSVRRLGREPRSVEGAWPPGYVYLICAALAGYVWHSWASLPAPAVAKMQPLDQRWRCFSWQEYELIFILVPETRPLCSRLEFLPGLRLTSFTIHQVTVVDCR